MENKRLMIDKSRMRRSFERAAARYDEMALLQKEVGERMMSRLDYIKIAPEWIVDIGAGTGECAQGLKKRYKKSHVVALDIALSMLQQAKKRNQWFKKVQLLSADAESLPIRADVVDMVFSNLMLQWCQDLSVTFQEWWRVLRPNGLLMFTTLGPDTLQELRESWRAVDQNAHVNPFIDMHDVGDQLIQAGFADPVMDVDRITLTYPDLRSLLQAIKGIGAHNVLTGQPRGLLGKRAYRRLEHAYEAFRTDGRLPATYEVVYGHAWMAPEKHRLQTPKGEAYVALDMITPQ